MQITTTLQADTTVAAISGRMDATTSGELDRWLAGWRNEGRDRLILDLGELDYISSAGLRSLLMAANQLQEAGGTLALCRVGGAPAEVLRMSGFLGFLPSYGSLEEACAALG